MAWSWAGAAEWLKEEKDRELEREKWEMARKDKMIGLILPELIERRKARTKRREEAVARISTAVSYNMDREAAAILEANGQLPLLLTRLNKLNENPDKDIDRNALKKLSEILVEKVSPEKLAAAMSYAIDDDFLEEPSMTKMVNALYAAELDELPNVAAELGAAGGTREKPGIGPFSINQMAFTAIGQEERKKVQETIEKAIAPQIGGSVTTNNAGQQVVQFEDPVSAAKIVQNAVDYYFSQTRDPMISRSEIDVIGDIYKKTLEYNSAEGGANLATIAATPFGSKLVVIPEPVTPPEGEEGSSAEEALTIPQSNLSEEEDYYTKFNLGG